MSSRLVARRLLRVDPRAWVVAGCVGVGVWALEGPPLGVGTSYLRLRCWATPLGANHRHAVRGGRSWCERDAPGAPIIMPLDENGRDASDELDRRIGEARRDMAPRLAPARGED